MRRFALAEVTACIGLVCAAALAAASGQNDRAGPIKVQITGLFSADREADLREAIAKIAGVKLVSIDFPNAEASLEVEAAKLFPKARAEEVVQKLDGMLKNASGHTFGVKAARIVPLSKLERIDIAVAGLDCKACCLAAYEAIYRLNGVEQATASFREGRVTAWIDSQKTNRAALEEALRKRGVEVMGRKEK